MKSIFHDLRLFVFLALVIIIFIGFAQVDMGNTLYGTPKQTTTDVTNTYSDYRKYLSFQLAPASRLGNHLFELASLIGISRVINRRPILFVESPVFGRMINDTAKVMPGIIDKILVVHGPLPYAYRKVVFNPRCCVYEDPLVLEGIDAQYLHLKGYFYQSYKYFKNLRSELIGYIKKPAPDFKILPKSKVLCTHIRRGDFVSNDFEETDPHFTKYAIEYVLKKEKLKNSVIFGDDAKFMKNLFEDSVMSDVETAPPNSTHFVSRNSAADDLIYSKNYCDVTIVTAPHSTFGWWLGYVSKGNKVYFMDIRVTKDAIFKQGKLNFVDYYPPGWTALKFSADNRTIIESPR